MRREDFPIPEEFKDQVHYVDALDDRSDEELLKVLTKHVAVTSERNVWAFWHAGVHSMPGWCQRNVCNWIRLLGPSWIVRVLDTVPGSPNNMLEWTTPDLLPEAMVKNAMDGPYLGPHSADFLRGACLWLYGGVAMDVGIILVRHLDQICWRQLEDPESPYQISAPLMFDPVMANHFVASRKRDPFIQRWHAIFLEAWKGRTNSAEIINHPLMTQGLGRTLDEMRARNVNWEWQVPIDRVMGYVGQVLAWQRLALLEDPNDGFSGVEYVLNNVLYFDVLAENWGADLVAGWTGQDLYDVFTTRRDLDPEFEQYKKAYKAVWRVLTRSSMQKVTHGKGMFKHLALGTLWDRTDNEKKDAQHGTFAELLRFGSVHLEQTRPSIVYVKVKKPDDSEIIRKGLLEV